MLTRFVCCSCCCCCCGPRTSFSSKPSSLYWSIIFYFHFLMPLTVRTALVFQLQQYDLTLSRSCADISLSFRSFPQKTNPGGRGPWERRIKRGRHLRKRSRVSAWIIRRRQTHLRIRRREETSLRSQRRREWAGKEKEPVGVALQRRNGFRCCCCRRFCLRSRVYFRQRVYLLHCVYFRFFIGLCCRFHSEWRRNQSLRKRQLQRHSSNEWRCVQVGRRCRSLSGSAFNAYFEWFVCLLEVERHCFDSFTH